MADLQREVREAIAAVAECTPGIVAPDMRLANLGLDKLGIFMVAVEIERRLIRTPRLAEVLEWKTPADVQASADRAK